MGDSLTRRTVRRLLVLAVPARGALAAALADCGGRHQASARAGRGGCPRAGRVADWHFGRAALHDLVGVRVGATHGNVFCRSPSLGGLSTVWRV
jgi:hypothetical protein